MFISSLVADIVRGMVFIHDSPMKFHANLKTSNCLVDSRWVLKLADFGLYVSEGTFIIVHRTTLRFQCLKIFSRSFANPGTMWRTF